MKRPRTAKPATPTGKEEQDVRLWGGDDTKYVADNPDLPNVYCNNARISFNNWDATLLFGTILGDAGDKLIVVPKVRVTMSLSFVKELRDLLNKNIKIFEEKVGTIHQINLDSPGDDLEP